MKNIKFFVVVLALVIVPAISFAAWSAPSASPTAGNTAPPINIGSIDQEKLSTITARGFCIRLSSGSVRCLGEDNGSTPTFYDFPWIQRGIHVLNTNPGNVYIKENSFPSTWAIVDNKELTVGGYIKAKGFCLGNSCLEISGSDTTNNWKTAITNLLGDTTTGGTGDVKAGTPITNNYLTKWSNTTTKTISNSSFYEDGTGNLCKGTGTSKVCIGNGAPGANGLTGIPGKDGTSLSCGAADSGKVLQWNGKGWVCGTVVGGGTTEGAVTVNNTTNTTNPLSGTVNRITKFTAPDKIGDSKLTDDGNFIKNSVPINTTGGGFIVENRTNDNVPTSQIGRLWFRTDI